MALLSGIRNSSHTVLFLQNSSAHYLLKPTLFFLQDATISKQHMLLIQRINKRVVFFLLENPVCWVCVIYLLLLLISPPSRCLHSEAEKDLDVNCTCALSHEFILLNISYVHLDKFLFFSYSISHCTNIWVQTFVLIFRKLLCMAGWVQVPIFLQWSMISSPG